MDDFGSVSTLDTPIDAAPLGCADTGGQTREPGADVVDSRCRSRRIMRRAAVVCAAPLVVLVGCTSGTGTDTGTGTPPAKAGPTSTVTAAQNPATPVVEPTWPTDCDSLGKPGTRSWAFDDGSSYPSDKVIPPFPGATLKLDCNWFAGDITSLSVTFTAGTPQAVTAAVDELLAEGYTCVDERGGRLCTTSKVIDVDIDVGFTVPTEFYTTVFARDGAWVTMVTSLGPDLLPTFMHEIVADLYP
ncbi:MAG: hypothetical protein FWF02_14425 [Micrococcales bacterium]|nr:hypothetical protein [Micrococcales bacterium]MCL2668873.1 hypothetical protein [Micrococcales bacterium]